MKKTIEQSMLDRILYIGNELPESLCTDNRNKFVLLGTPAEVIDETTKDFFGKGNFQIACWIAEYCWKKANPESKFSEPPSMVYEQVAKDFNKFLAN